LQDKDILLVAKWTRNFAALYRSEYWPCVASSTFFIIRLNRKTRVIPEYLSIILNDSQNRKYFQNNFSGSTIPSIPKSVLEDFEIPLPSIEKQEQIIRLDALHKKEIRLRNKLIEKKEQMIHQMIFTSAHL
jgi:restriction endonuclease S subunit